MTEGTDVINVALAWVEAQRARGVTVYVRGKRIGMAPKSAYSALSNEDRATLRSHRAEIIRVLEEQHAGVARPATPQPVVIADAERAPEPAPEPCRWCGSWPCIGPEHEAFRVLHPLEEQKLADEHATREMLARVGRPHPWWDGC